MCDIFFLVNQPILMMFIISVFFLRNLTLGSCLGDILCSRLRMIRKIIPFTIPPELPTSTTKWWTSGGGMSTANQIPSRINTPNWTKNASINNDEFFAALNALLSAVDPLCKVTPRRFDSSYIFLQINAYKVAVNIIKIVFPTEVMMRWESRPLIPSKLQLKRNNRNTFGDIKQTYFLFS